MLSLRVISGIFITFFIQLSKKQCAYAQGIDVGPVADPLKFGLIDPLVLEVGATYLLVAPFVVFVMGILVIPVTLVFLFLIILPLYVPTSPSHEGRSLRSGIQFNPSEWRSSSSSYFTNNCIKRIICEISDGNWTSQANLSKQYDIIRTAANKGHSVIHHFAHPKKRRNVRPCRKIACEPYETISKLSRKFYNWLKEN